MNIDLRPRALRDAKLHAAYLERAGGPDVGRHFLERFILSGDPISSYAFHAYANSANTSSSIARFPVESK